MSDPIIQFENVRRSFGSLDAVRNLSLAVGAGERVVLVGHNGAGKTTLFKLLLGLIRPDAGSIRLFGAAPGSLQARRAIAYLPENVAFSGALTGRETLRFFCRLRGENPATADGLLERVGLAEAGKRAVRTYSKGMRQRLGLAQALIGSPRLLVLDEPTSGLDPVSRKMFYDIVDTCAAKGMTVLISTHALAEMEIHADRIIVMKAGRIVADGTLSELRRQTLLPIRVRVEAHSMEATSRLAEAISGRRINGHAFEFTCERAELADRLERLAALGPGLADLEVHPPGLDQITLELSSLPQAEEKP